jgi:hypothetical protein
LAEAEEVQLWIYNLLGQLVAILDDSKREAGTYHLTWESNGSATGLYFAVLKTGKEYHTEKLMLIR